MIMTPAEGCPPCKWVDNGDGPKDFCSCTTSATVSCYNNYIRFDSRTMVRIRLVLRIRAMMTRRGSGARPRRHRFQKRTARLGNWKVWRKLPIPGIISEYQVLGRPLMARSKSSAAEDYATKYSKKSST